MSIYDAAMKYQEGRRAAGVVAGQEYGTGSSRDWARKVRVLLGVEGCDCTELRRIHPQQSGGHGRFAMSV